MLTKRELERYNRQILFRAFGEEGQEKLKSARVLVAGVGGLGSTVAMYLTTSGIGRIVLVDSDTVSLSNLNRQLLHWEKDVDRKKVDSGVEKIQKMNSDIRVEAVPVKITQNSCEYLLRNVDVAVDCLDNMKTRYILNRACVEKKVPLVHGGVYGMLGQVTTILPGDGPCLECIFPHKEERGNTIPVFGPTAGFTASLQVLEVIKLLTGIGELLRGRLLYFNGEIMECIFAEVEKREDCQGCGNG
jgi:adenylyltransferase/sulfurtransferase